MALKQTRRTISVSRAQYERAKERSASDAIPLSQAVEQLLEMWLTGAVEIGPAREIGKLTDAQVAEIRERYRVGEKMLSIAIDYGCHQSHISKLCRGERRAAPVVAQERVLSPAPPVPTPLAALAQRKLDGIPAVRPQPVFLPRGTCGTCGDYPCDDRLTNEDGVPECAACRTVAAVVQHGPERGYEATGDRDIRINKQLGKTPRKGIG